MFFVLFPKADEHVPYYRSDWTYWTSVMIAAEHCGALGSTTDQNGHYEGNNKKFQSLAKQYWSICVKLAKKNDRYVVAARMIVSRTNAFENALR